MYSATVKPVQSLDQQYLDFTARTASVFDQYPQLEPLRYFIFKQLLIQRHSVGWTGRVKHWLRPLLRPTHTHRGSDRAEVLIWIESGREVIVDALLPVYSELVSRGVEVKLVAWAGPDDLPDSTIHIQVPGRAIPPAWTRDAWEALGHVAPELNDPSLARSFFFTCANLQAQYDELDQVLNELDPKVALVASTQLAGGASLVVACRWRGVLSLLLQHGIVQAFYTPVLADYMLTWGQTSNETLMHLGVEAEKLIPLGSPRHDAMVPSSDGRGRAALLGALSLPDRPTFVFFSNGNDLVRNADAPLECAKWLETTAAQFSGDINIVVRLHPNENGRLYRGCRRLHITKNSLDLATMLDGCDWVGSLCSTVLYDALLYQKPVWQFYADGWPELADNWKNGLAIRISSQCQLSEMVSRILVVGRDHAANDGVISRVFSNHGRATQAIADFVQSPLEEKSGGFEILKG
ncbi:MAG: hypothetical protein HY314_12895 [Acidobacteria bacterium]|nr:hypothetical protein [Acidobacteriota bacterium]